VTENQEYRKFQMLLCQKYGAGFLAANPNDTVGVARDLFAEKMPVNGLRHPVSMGTCGWYLWSGLELKSDADFFVPMHLDHLLEMRWPFLRFLGLAPGWRFLTDGISEDVWFDESLLNI
jgi:hypothetical protein